MCTRINAGSLIKDIAQPLRLETIFAVYAPETHKEIICDIFNFDLVFALGIPPMLWGGMLSSAMRNTPKMARAIAYIARKGYVENGEGTMDKDLAIGFPWSFFHFIMHLMSPQDFTAFSKNGITVATIESCLQDVVQRTAGSWDHYFPGDVWTTVSCVTIFLGHAKLGAADRDDDSANDNGESQQELLRILTTHGTFRQLTEQQYITKSVSNCNPMLVAAEGYLWAGQLSLARELADFVVVDVDSGFARSWAHRLLGIVHAMSAGGRQLAEAAFMEAIREAKQTEVAMQEAQAVVELKRRVLEPSGRGDEADELLAEPAQRVGGTAEELAHALTAWRYR